MEEGLLFIEWGDGCYRSGVSEFLAQIAAGVGEASVSSHLVILHPYLLTQESGFPARIFCELLPLSFEV